MSIMEIKVTFNMDDEFQKEFFQQTYRHAYLRTKIMFGAAIVFLVLGIVGLALHIGIAAPIVLIALGVYELFGVPIKRHFWLKKYFNDNNSGKEVSYTFTGSDFKAESSVGKSEIKWEGIIKAKETDKGFLLWLQKELHMYLPKSVLPEEAINLIRKKCLTSL